MAAADLAAMGVSAGREDFGCALQRLHEFLACGDCSQAVGVHARMSGGRKLRVRAGLAGNWAMPEEESSRT